MTIGSESELLQQKVDVASRSRRRLDPTWFSHGGNERLEMAFDLEMHIAFLAESVRLQVPRLFFEYLHWTCQLLTTAGGDADRLDACVRAIVAEMRDHGSGEWVERACKVASDACRHMRSAPPPAASHWRDDNPHRRLGESFLAACLAMRRGQAVTMVQQAVKSGVPVEQIYTDVITPAMHELGSRWHRNEVTVAQEHYCTAVAQTVMAQLFPAIFDEQRRQAGRMVAACVANELHEIGARMVADLFEMAGWDTVFLGADVPRESVVDTVVETQAGILAISVTLGAHLQDAEALIAAVRAEPACAGVKVLVGGAAFAVDPDLWQRIGADGWAPDPRRALHLAATWGP